MACRAKLQSNSEVKTLANAIHGKVILHRWTKPNGMDRGWAGIAHPWAWPLSLEWYCRDLEDLSGLVRIHAFRRFLPPLHTSGRIRVIPHWIFFVHPNPVFYHKLVQVSFRRAMDLKGSLSNASLCFCIMMQELQEVLIFKYHIVVFNSKVGRHVS